MLCYAMLCYEVRGAVLVVRSATLPRELRFRASTADGSILLSEWVSAISRCAHPRSAVARESATADTAADATAGAATDAAVMDADAAAGPAAAERSIEDAPATVTQLSAEQQQQPQQRQHEAGGSGVGGGDAVSPGVGLLRATWPPQSWRADDVHVTPIA